MKSLTRVDIYFKAMVVPESRRKFKIFESVHMMRTFLYMNVCVLPFQIGAWSQQKLSYLHSLAGYYTQHRKTPENRLPALERRGPCVPLAFPSLCGELEWTGASKQKGPWVLVLILLVLLQQQQHACSALSSCYVLGDLQTHSFIEKTLNL